LTPLEKCITFAYLTKMTLSYCDYQCISYWNGKAWIPLFIPNCCQRLGMNMLNNICGLRNIRRIVPSNTNKVVVSY